VCEVCTSAFQVISGTNRVKATMCFAREACRSTMEADTEFRDQNNAAAAVQKANFELLDKTLQQFISGIASGHTRVSDVFKSENATTRQLIGKEHADTRTHLEKKLNDSHFETITEDQRRRFLNSLSYEEMNGRKNQISATCPEIFWWIFERTVQRPWPNFTKWLEQGSRVYSAFAAFTTVPWNHTTRQYQTDLLERHDGTKPGPRYRRDDSDGTIEIEKLGVVLIIALFVGY
jgi:hypothetical protein